MTFFKSLVCVCVHMCACMCICVYVLTCMCMCRCLTDGSVHGCICISVSICMSKLMYVSILTSHFVWHRFLCCAPLFRGGWLSRELLRILLPLPHCLTEEHSLEHLALRGCWVSEMSLKHFLSRIICPTSIDILKVGEGRGDNWNSVGKKLSQNTKWHLFSRQRQY